MNSSVHSIQVVFHVQKSLYDALNLFLCTEKDFLNETVLLSSLNKEVLLENKRDIVGEKSRIPSLSGPPNTCTFRLTEREKRDLDYKKKILRLAKDHKSAGDVEKRNRYYIPKEDEKQSDKYVEEEGPIGMNDLTPHINPFPHIDAF